MVKDGVIYFNFPITILKGYTAEWCSGLEDQRAKLLRILYYVIYERNKKDGAFVADLAKCKKEGINANALPYKNGVEMMFKEGHWLREYDNYDGPYFSISQDLLAKFFGNESSQEEREHLLAYLALKSIVGVRHYYKTNRFMLASRMACNRSTVKEEELPEEIAKYLKRYWFDKLREDLFKEYNIAFYSDSRTKGFYVSLKKTDDGRPDLVWLAKRINKDREKKNTGGSLKQAMTEAMTQAKESDSTKEQQRAP